MSNEEISRGYVPRENPAQLNDLWLRQQRSQGENIPREVEILGKRFVIFPGVHSPAFYADTAFFASYIIPRIRPGSRFLEIGCGTGVVSILAALKGANVTATDINPQAITNTKENARLHGVELPVLEGDVYGALPEETTYDTICWNVPFAYVNTDKDKLSTLARAVFDPQHDGLKKYILGAKKHLNKGGELLLGYSSTLGDLNAIRAYAKQAGLQFTVIASTIDPKDSKQEKRFDLLIAYNP